MKHSILLTFSLLLFTSPAASVQPVELMPFTFAGRIVDYAHVAYDSDTAVEVRVKTQDGVLLAKTKTQSYQNSAFNYVVNVPMSSQVISGHVTNGTSVVFEFVELDTNGDVERIYNGIVTEGDAKIGNPGDYRKVNLILASDADGDGVADEYVESLEYLMWENGIENYDPNADYDGDGQSNYAEYIAGSNPFDKTDTFSFRAMAIREGIEGYVALRVCVEEGRTYTVSTSGRLGKDVSEWTKDTFSVGDPSAALQNRITTGGSESGYRTIYVRKDGDSRFWKISVE